MTIYKSKRIALPDGFFDGYMVVEEGRITALTTTAPDGFIVDLTDDTIAPGFVDTHVHGMMNHDVMDVEEGALDQISNGLLTSGVTSFLATTLTAPSHQLDAAVTLIAKEADEVTGAKVRGIFLEGPFFTPAHKGAQNPDYMSPPCIDTLRHWQELSGGRVKKIAIAPEYDNTVDFVKEATAMGVTVALAHSAATYTEAMKAIDAGASIFCHTYNGMSPLHHRDPGMVGAALTTDAYAELICDGRHVHPGAVKVVLRAKGFEQVVLVSDCMMAGGMPEGNYMLGDFPVVVKDGVATISNGSLAGSVLKLAKAVENLVSWEASPLFEAIQMASLIPAKSVGIDDVCGRLDIGRSADFVVLDGEGVLISTYLSGALRAKAGVLC